MHNIISISLTFIAEIWSCPFLQSRCQRGCNSKLYKTPTGNEYNLLRDARWICEYVYFAALTVCSDAVLDMTL